MMAGSKTLPSKGRIQMSQTNYLQIAKSGLQPTAGPYRRARSCRQPTAHLCAGFWTRRVRPGETSAINVVLANREAIVFSFR